MQSVLQSAVVEGGVVSSSLWSGILPTLTPCVTKQHRPSEKEMKDYFWSLFITSLIYNKFQHVENWVKSPHVARLIATLCFSALPAHVSSAAFLFPTWQQ